jgi:hypothetical protein
MVAPPFAVSPHPSVIAGCTVFGGTLQVPLPEMGLIVATTVPIVAFIATVKLNGVPDATVFVDVAVASVEPAPFAPEKIVRTKVSLPTGAPNVSVQLRDPLAVAHRLEVALTSNICAVPPLTAIETDEAFGETNCG